MVDQLHRLIGVLIIDDHLVLAESLARLLADEDDILVMGVASSAAEGIELVTQLKPQVVLVDYEMPGQNGVDAAAEIRRRAPDTKVVMLTGSCNDQVLVAAIEVGCKGFVTKGRSSAEVAAAVRAAARGEAAISSAMLARLLSKLNTAQSTSVGSDLTDRERSILALLAAGETTSSIASQLHLSVNTVRNYVQSVINKLGAHSKLEAVSLAVRQGIVAYPATR